MSQEARSEALIEVLEQLEQSDIGFVLVGGYAVSQFETRFSTDLDLVIAPDDYETVVTFLQERDFEREAELEVPPDETMAAVVGRYGAKAVPSSSTVFSLNTIRFAQPRLTSKCATSMACGSGRRPAGSFES